MKGDRLQKCRFDSWAYGLVVACSVSGSETVTDQTLFALAQLALLVSNSSPDAVWAGLKAQLNHAAEPTPAVYSVCCRGCRCSAPGAAAAVRELAVVSAFDAFGLAAAGIFVAGAFAA